MLKLGAVAIAIGSLYACGNLSPFGAQNPDDNHVTRGNAGSSLFDESGGREGPISHSGVLAALTALDAGLDVDIFKNSTYGIEEQVFETCQEFRLRPSAAEFYIEGGETWGAGQDCRVTMTSRGVASAGTFYYHPYQIDNDGNLDEESWFRLPVSPAELGWSCDRLGGFSELLRAITIVAGPEKISGRSAVYPVPLYMVQDGLMGFDSGPLQSNFWETETSISVTISLDDQGRLSEYFFEIDSLDEDSPGSHYKVHQVMSYDLDDIEAPKVSMLSDLDPGEKGQLMFLMALES